MQQRDAVRTGSGGRTHKRNAHLSDAGRGRTQLENLAVTIEEKILNEGGDTKHDEHDDQEPDKAHAPIIVPPDIIPLIMVVPYLLSLKPVDQSRQGTQVVTGSRRLLHDLGCIAPAAQCFARRP